MFKLPSARKFVLAAALAGAVVGALAAEPPAQKPAPSGLPRLLPPGTESGGDSFKQLASGTYDYSRAAGPQNHAERSLPAGGTGPRGSLQRVADADASAAAAADPATPASAGTNPAPPLPGELSSSAVPEASTYALLLAGLMAIGFVAIRRRPN